MFVRKNKTKATRMLSFLLALLMMLTLIQTPLSALALEHASEDETQISNEERYMSDVLIPEGADSIIASDIRDEETSSSDGIKNSEDDRNLDAEPDLNDARNQEDVLPDGAQNLENVSSADLTALSVDAEDRSMMKPFEDFIDTEPYYAAQGSYIIPLTDIRDANLTAGSWYTVKLKHTTNQTEVTLTEKLYGVGWSNGDTANNAIVLGAQNLLAGTYNIDVTVNSQTVLLERPLRIVGSSEKVILGVSGADYDRAVVQMNDTYSAGSIVQSVFRNGYVSSDYFDGNFTLHNYPDDVIISVCGYNITAADITAAFLKDGADSVAELKAVIPASAKSFGSAVELLLVFNKISGKDASEGSKIELTLANDVINEADENIYHAAGDRYWLDYSEVADRKLYIVAEDPPETLPQKILCKLYYSVYIENKWQDIQIGEPIEATIQNANRYFLELPTNMEIFGNGTLYVEFTPYSNDIKSVQLSVWNFLGTNLPSEMLTNINNQTFDTYPISRGYNGESASFSLVNASFTPVQGVTITKDDSYEDFSGIRYKFTAPAALTPDAAYYIMLGSLPVGKFTAKTSLSTGSDRKYLQMSSYGYKGLNSFYFGVNSPGVPVVPSTWSVKLISKMPGRSTYTLSTTSSTHHLMTEMYDNGTRCEFHSDLDSIDPGPYDVEFYVNNVKQTTSEFEEISYNNFFFCFPTVTENHLNSFGWSRDWSNGVITNTYLGGWGYAVSSAPISGWKLDAYKMDNTFLNTTPISVSVPTITPEAASSWFEFKVSSAALKSAGMTAGVWWVVAKDSNGQILNVEEMDITTKFLNPSAAPSYTLSGTVTLAGAALPNATVKLMQGSTEIRSTTTGSTGAFSFAEVERGTYTVKILEGKTWKEYVSSSINLTQSHTVPTIDLEYSVPTYSVSGTVKAENVPVSGYLLSIFKKGSTTSLANTMTDANGAYSFAAVPDVPDETDTYIIKANVTADYKAYESAEFVVDGADITNKDITLTLRPYITGVVKLGGTPKADVYIYLYKGNSYIASAKTDKDGIYVFKAVEENTTYTLEIYGDEYSGSATVTSGVSGKTEKDIDLKSYLSLSGKVTLDNIAVPNIYVTLSTDNQIYWAYTDREGNYSFNRIPNDSEYKISVNEAAEYEEYVDTVDLSTTTTHDIALIAAVTYKVTFTFENVTGTVPVSLYVYSQGSYSFYIGKSADAEVADHGTIDITGLRNGNYGWSTYIDGQYLYGSVAVNGAHDSVTVTLDTTYVVSGTVQDTGAGARVTLEDSTNYYYYSVVTDKDGKFAVKVLPGTYVITVSSEEGYYRSGPTLVSGAEDLGAITLESNSLAITAIDEDTREPIADVYISAGNRWAYTDENGKATLKGLPTGNIWVYAWGQNYFSNYEEIAISAGENTVEIELRKDPYTLYDVSFKLSNDEVSSGGYVDIRPMVSSTDPNPSGGTMTLNIPDSLNVNAALASASGYSSTDGWKTLTYSVNLSSSVKAVNLPSLRLIADENLENMSTIWIDGKYTFGSPTSYDKYTSAHITVVNTTLEAPALAKANADFTVYGTAFSGSIVQIQDADGKVLSTVRVSDRYFRAKIKLPAGDYVLTAVSAKSGSIATSDPVKVKVEENAVQIQNIKITSHYTNSDNYGFPTFSAWVDTSYRGIDTITGSFDIVDIGDYTLKGAYFCGASVPYSSSADGTHSFSFPAYSWSGTGTKPITVVLSKDGVDYTFTIALVTLMIDPSGYVYDAKTNARIEGATVTLEKLVGKSWTKWADPNGIQLNPQITDDEGKYGWYVENGTYRVVVKKDNYEDFIANVKDGSYSTITLETGIVIPPPETEVNIGLVYTLAPTVTAAYNETDKTIELTFTRPMVDGIQNGIIVKVSDAEIDGVWTWNADKTVLTFKPADEFKAGVTVTIIVPGASLSQDNKAIGADQTLTVNIPGSGEPTNPPSNSPSGGGASGTLPVTEPVKAETITINGKTFNGKLLPDGTLEISLTADEAKKLLGNEKSFNVTIPKYTAIQFSVPISALGNVPLTIETDFGTLTISNKTLQNMKNKFGDLLTLVIKKGSFSVALMAEGKEMAYDDPQYPLAILLPCEVTGNRNSAEYVMVKKVNRKNVIVPFAVNKNGKISADVGSTGVFDAVYNGKTFTDIEEHWGKDYIAFVAARELFSGTGNNQFSPDSSMTRAMFATVLARLDGADLSAYTSSRFNDVPNGEWYTASIEWAADKGIVNGVGDGAFAPNQDITREQMAVMLYQYVAYKGYSLTMADSAGAFNDAANISDWAAEAVSEIQKAGIITGKPNNLFDPQGIAVRAEVATIFARFIEGLSK